LKTLKKTQAILALDLLMIAIALFGSIAVPSHSANTTYVLSNANIYAEQTVGPGSGSGDTNATGQYTIEQGINPGDYTVEAKSDGYIRAIGNTTVKSSSDSKIMDFYLNRSAIIVGRVMGSDGQPVVTASVTLRDNSTDDWIDSTSTDSDGRYYFATDVDTGVYYAEADGFYYPFISQSYSHIDVSTRYVGYVSGGRSTPVSVTAGSTVSASDIVLDVSGIITGIVSDDHGNPLANVTVTAVPTSLGGSYSSATSNSTGGYRMFYDIANATYGVQPSLYGYVADSTDVIGTEGMTVVQNLTMTSSATLQGTVLRESDDTPIPDAFISLFSNDFKYFGSATTSNNGSYAIATGLGAADYTVSVTL
jgi:protocatechuate 3,4-dioxygenase beta subunit